MEPQRIVVLKLVRLVRAKDGEHCLVSNWLRKSVDIAKKYSEYLYGELIKIGGFSVQGNVRINISLHLLAGILFAGVAELLVIGEV